MATSSVLAVPQPSLCGAQTRQNYARHVDLAAAGFLERLRWSAGRRRTFRDEALRRQLRHAGEHSPWHRERLAGVNIDDIAGDDLSGLPTMDRSDLLANWDAIVTDPQVTLHLAEDVLDFHAIDGDPLDKTALGRYVVTTSSGSTGKRGVFVYSLAEIATATAASHAMTNAQILDGVLPDVSAGPGAALFGLAAVHPEGEVVAELNDTQPEHLVGYPSVLARYASHAVTGRLWIAPQRVMSNGEPLLPGVRALLEEAWGVPVDNGYTGAEGFVACSYGGSAELHVADDLAILELVDDAGRPVAPGETSAKVLLTRLHNRTQPLIRYEVTDQLSLVNGPPPGPWEGQWIATPAGRLDDSFTYAAGPTESAVTIHPHAFRRVLHSTPAVIEYRVRQTCRGADIEVTTRERCDLAGLRDRMVASLADAGLEHPVIEVSAVPAIEGRGITGKLARFVPLAMSRHSDREAR